MANNGILIEAGVPTGPELREFSEIFRTLAVSVEGMKAESMIEEYRMYVPVTGNRTERGLVLMLECSSDQLEALVNSKPYVEIMVLLMSKTPNFTTTRVIFGDLLERIQEEA